MDTIACTETAETYRVPKTFHPGNKTTHIEAVIVHAVAIAFHRGTMNACTGTLTSYMRAFEPTTIFYKNGEAILIKRARTLDFTQIIKIILLEANTFYGKLHFYGVHCGSI